ncbi:PREDICTED: ubiquitin conjugation factor E4 A-like [Priapulus caudatus]|uniref:Ubiquitin conjugation factor E4 A n=1 Tax=Priapulus caudatus TaxID=37621 RepID=A0ABM1E3R0_PRICU|nr:PREDICTED: ubiquitin conjugation factor E4 A-like [Priapulus caudatus]
MDSEGVNLSGNPFAQLFPSLSEAQHFSVKATLPSPDSNKSDEDKKETKTEHTAFETRKLLSVSYLLERIFLITLDKGRYSLTDGLRPSFCVYLAELHDTLEGQTWLDRDCLEQAVFERLMHDDSATAVIPTRNAQHLNRDGTTAAAEPRILPYLCQCYIRACKEEALADKTSDEDIFRHVQNVIVSNSKTALIMNELYANQDIQSQLLTIFHEHINFSECEAMYRFLEAVAVAVDSADEAELSDIWSPVLEEMRKSILALSLVDSAAYQYMELLKFLTHTACLARVVVEFTTPKNPDDGRAYETSLLGCTMSLSCLVKNPAAEHGFFENPSSSSQQEHKITEQNVWRPIKELNDSVYTVFYNLLRASPDIRHRMLGWLGGCLRANSGRTKLWTNHQFDDVVSPYASDGFLLNLTNVLLRLCKPFAEPMSQKLLRIDLSYRMAVASSDQDAKERGIHMRGLAKETCLIPAAEGDNNNGDTTQVRYNFSTECFFMAHYSFYLGFQVVHGKLVKLSQELGRIQRVWEDARDMAGDSNDSVRRIHQAMDKGMTRFLSMKAGLLEPHSLELALNFHVATATLLNHLGSSRPGAADYQPMVFPLVEEGSESLENIPEFMMENVVDFMTFLRRFQDDMFQTAGSQLEHLMTLTLVFMGSPARMRNPHLRAKLAEALEALMPHQDQRLTMVSMLNRRQLFVAHPHIRELAATLLHVFVSIEMTGQSVQFELKFNYRRPMYIALEYIWGLDLHKQRIKELADHALQNIEATDSPLFLRFVNLLINDAIFLLDEALQVPSDLIPINQSSIKYLDLIAILIITLITPGLSRSATHSHVRAFLNVAPSNVTRPSQAARLTSRDINVAPLTSADAFIHEHSHRHHRAPSRSGQPAMYATENFSLAAYQEVASKQQAEDELLEEAPEEFLDPILGTIMRDPVLLPTSGHTMDRSTIARHILSDQSDPFNRQPLSMEMVVPNEQLKQQINEWIQAHRDQKQHSKQQS